MFFQSNVISIPCAHYKLEASFDLSFRNRFGNDYIFRYEVFPPDPQRTTVTEVSCGVNCHDLDKGYVSVGFDEGVRPGTGYALAISKVIPASCGD